MKTMKKTLPMGARLLVPDGIDSNGKVKFRAINIPAGAEIVVTFGAASQKRKTRTARRGKSKPEKKNSGGGAVVVFLVIIGLILLSYITQ